MGTPICKAAFCHITKVLFFSFFFPPFPFLSPSLSVVVKICFVDWATCLLPCFPDPLRHRCCCWDGSKWEGEPGGPAPQNGLWDSLPPGSHQGTSWVGKRLSVSVGDERTQNKNSKY